MWNSILYVTTGLSLAAFLAAVGAFALRTTSLHKWKMIESAPPEARGALVANVLQHFHVDPSGLTRKQQYDLALLQIRARAQRFLVTSLIVLCIALVGGAISAYAISKMSISGGHADSQERVSYRGYVKDSGTGQGIRGAKVEVETSGCAPAVTGDDGGFEIEGCLFRGEPTARVTLERHSVPCLGGYTLTPDAISPISVDAGTCPLAEAVETDKVRVTFSHISGHFVDLLATGRIASAFPDRATGKWVVARNDILRTLEKIHRDHKSAHSAGDFYGTPWGDIEEWNEHNPDAYRSLHARLSASGSVHQLTDTGARAASTPDVQQTAYRRPDELTELLSTGGWHPVRLSLGPADGWRKGISFWRYAKDEDLAWMPGFYTAAAGHPPPPGFLVVLAEAVVEDNYTCEGGEVESRYSAHVTLRADRRYISVVTLLVENVSSVPVSLGGMRVRKHSPAGLRTSEEERIASMASPLVGYEPYAPRKLAPQETLAIPIRIEFSLRDDGDTVVAEIERGEPVYDALTSFDPFAEITIDEEAGKYLAGIKSLVSINEATLVRGGAPKLVPDFVLGPSIVPVEVNLDGHDYTLRRESDAKEEFWLRDGVSGMSCPFVYIWKPGGEKYHFVDAILKGRRGKARESSDSLWIDGFDGRILIREEEREVTFLKDVYFVPEGGRERLYPLLEKGHSLSGRTGDYLELRYGDSLELRFGEWEEGVSGLLVAKGYFEPDAP